MYGPLSTLNHMRSCIVRAMELKPYLSLFSEDPRPGLDFGLWLNMMRYHKYILEQGSHLPMLIPKTNLQIKFKKLNYEWKRISIELSLSPPHLNLGKNLIPYMQKNLILNLHIGHNEQYRFRIFKTKNHYFVYFKYKIYKNSNLISLELQEPYKRWRRLNNSLFGLFDQEYTFWPMDGFNLSAFKAHEFINLCKCKYTKKSVQKMAKHSKKCQFCGSGLYSKVTLKKGKCISCLDKLV